MTLFDSPWGIWSFVQYLQLLASPCNASSSNDGALLGCDPFPPLSTGSTGGDVESRVANAKKDPTYLLADVEIVATYKLANVNRQGLEALLHKFLGSARLDLELKDRFGLQVEPREWFLVSLSVIDEAIQKLMAGTITRFRYDAETARLVVA
jgi:hypothetical protein